MKSDRISLNSHQKMIIFLKNQKVGNCNRQIGFYSLTKRTKAMTVVKKKFTLMNSFMETKMQTTEVHKQKQRLERLAKDGTLSLHILILGIHQLIKEQSTTIIVEIQMVNRQFGAIPQMLHQGGSTVILCTLSHHQKLIAKLGVNHQANNTVSMDRRANGMLRYTMQI